MKPLESISMTALIYFPLIKKLSWMFILILLNLDNKNFVEKIYIFHFWLDYFLHLIYFFIFLVTTSGEGGF
jgi:hypothetical protein